MTTDTVHLTGSRIALRDWREDDVSVFMPWQAPAQRWHELDGPYYPKPSVTDLAHMEARLRDSIAENIWPTPRRRLVIAGAINDELQGVVTWYWESEETNWLSVGIVIFDPAMWGKGFGFEALGLWTGYLFATMPQLARSDLRTWSGNIGMMRLAEKVGYQQEARFRKARIVNGEHYDGMGYGILREEWDARFPDGFVASLR